MNTFQRAGTSRIKRVYATQPETELLLANIYDAIDRMEPGDGWSGPVRDTMSYYQAKDRALSIVNQYLTEWRDKQ